MTDELVAFLRARLDEDEQWAREVQERFLQDHGSRALIIEGAAGMWSTVNVAARVQREVEANRRIIEAFTIAERNVEVVRRSAPDYRLVREAEAARDALLHAVRLLALPHADHPGFREEWKP